ncbi:MAG: LuxR family transcriptional regulator, partial [Eggerthellaceae bacterium]|nr:LuxR family transcriptional regulator [Eggerthellaceae bacterium]
MQDAFPLKRLSSRRIAGFACNQGFVFFLFYMGENRGYSFGAWTFERAELIGTLFFMVLALLGLRLISEKMQRNLFARPILLLYALMLATGSLVPYFVGESTFVWWLAECFLVGIPCALLLTAWGRSFGEASTKASVPEVFLASLFGALFGLAVSFMPISRADLAFRVLPFISALALMSAPQAIASLKPAVLVEGPSRETARLSTKIIAGTALFGLAAGFMETFNTDPGSAAMPAYGVALLL